MTYTKQNAFYEKLEIINDSSTSEQVLSWVNASTWYDLTGSQITYIPSKFSKYVIYEYNFFLGRTNAESERSCSFMFELMKDDNDGNGFSAFGDNTSGTIGDVGTQTRRRSTHSIKLCLDAANWNSPKTLKLRVRRNTSSQIARFNKLFRFYGQDETDLAASGEVNYYPTVSCYSVSH